MAYELYWASRCTEIAQHVGGVLYIIAVYGSVRHRERHDKRNKDSDTRHCYATQTVTHLSLDTLQKLWPFYAFSTRLWAWLFNHAYAPIYMLSVRAFNQFTPLAHV